ncbi:hypothetical protein COT42_01590 [Candidatus Saganbacteria bacterium CG08_land_8_20_14_0_20_45_16]|uniref:Bacterial type II secretion system protein E domain-containing protein n=1 Tax=Candidatus Saganbacteria bacterium CG08_land_8_20_14_0_20_45_16 TaxID=2014293 RepID=A0A2H0Y154_UNCSA|nr:MAG: hypothetical protein COT42_01590 [Candidatus Saganbacteria bacterium CG08_land_8_20_14_0_20_45_16]
MIAEIGLLKKEQGLVLIPGLSVAEILNHFEGDGRKIVTLPKVIECSSQAISPAAHLRALLKHNHDVIIIELLEDVQVIKIAMQAAMTGHLVVAGFAASDEASAREKLKQMDIDPFLVSSSLIGVV